MWRVANGLDNAVLKCIFEITSNRRKRNQKKLNLDLKNGYYYPNIILCTFCPLLSPYISSLYMHAHKHSSIRVRDIRESEIYINFRVAEGEFWWPPGRVRERNVRLVS